MGGAHAGRIALACVAAVGIATLPGCGLLLDYGPPDPVAADGGGLDSGALDVGTSDAGDGGATSCADGCDDGLRCTFDACLDGVCTHQDACPGGTECVARGTEGECRLPCDTATECDDHVDCTQDLCDATDHHCRHVSGCASARPVCLDTSVCVPDGCTQDAECSDGDLCNGEEHCVSGECRAGTPVVCDAPSLGCVHQACEPSRGACVPVLDDGSCDDGVACTHDTCGTDGDCTHSPVDAACATGDLCDPRSCDPALSTDASGCAGPGRTVCDPACGVSGTCVSSTGLCSYGAVCAAGEVCTPSGCQPTLSCSGNADCAGQHDLNGCATICVSHTCMPHVCPLPPVGGCARLAVDSFGCPASPDVCYVADATLCDDLDPLTTDSCNPDTFACSHTCPTATGPSCVTYTATADGHCAASLDAAFCAAQHPTGPGDCARWTCVGNATGGTSVDGCAPQAVDAACDDGAGCTDDTCTLSASTRTGTCAHATRADVATYCADLFDCTNDACDPAMARDASGCTHTLDDSLCTSAAGPLQCADTACVPGSAAGVLGMRTLPTGCGVEYTPSSCGIALPGICTLDGLCTVVTCGAGSGTRCDDGNPCNGTERCALGLCVQDLVGGLVCALRSGP